MLANSNIPEKKPSYVEYINKNEKYKDSEKYLKDEKFWKEYVKDIQVSNNFENIKHIKSNRLEMKLKNELFKEIQNYCIKNKITEYTFFLAIIAIYFMKIYSRDNIVIGTPFLNRAKRDNELLMMGMFVSTLPIKIDISNIELTFQELCHNISNTNLLCYKHSKYPYYNIQKEYQKQTETNTNLYDIVFSYQINSLKEKINGDTGQTIWFHNNSQVNPIIISYVNHFGEHKIYYDYLVELFGKKAIKEIHERIITIIENVIKHKQVKISNIGILSNKDIINIKQFNKNGIVKYKNENIVTRFKNIVEANKNKIAVKCGNESITYEELDKKSDYVAINLKKYKNAPIAIVLDKSIDMIIIMLGIMKSSNYYIPILPEEEQKRMKYIIENSNAKLVIANKNIGIEAISTKQLIKKNEGKIEDKTNEEDIAYMIYTSGTTGEPKGVMMQHKNIISLMQSINKDSDLKFKNGDIAISLLKYSFDASAIDIYTSLLNGGTLILVPKEIELNPKAVVEIMEKEKVTRCFTVHKWIEQIQKYGGEKIKLRFIGTGAEVLKPENFKQLLKKVPIYNTYGPTETTMFVTKHKINSKDIKANVSPIGGLIPFVRAVVVNNNNQILPIDTKGELVIYEDEKSAKNIAKGYYNLEDKTSEKFIKLKLPYSKKVVNAYKTGDIVKINKNLELEFYGRQDDFVKVNGGYLVSLKEVEKTIQKLLGKEIEVCAIAVKKEIILFVVKNGYAINIKKESIMRTINKNMTFYMKPKTILELEELPRNKNGKVDKEKLLSYANKNIKQNREKVKPSTELEKQIYEKVRKIIDYDFSITDDFEDDLGLDSLNITSLYTEIEEDKISIQDLYNYSTVQDLANMIKSEYSKEDSGIEDIQVLNNSKKMELSTVLLTGATGFLGANMLKELAYNDSVNKIYCLIRSRINMPHKERFRNTINRYFNKEEKTQILSKTIILEGDLTKVGLGIPDKILKDIKCIINPAANVKHIGKYKDFYRDNVLTVNNIIDICKKYNIGFMHISTLSLNGMNGKQGEVFNENILDIGQSFGKNPYLLSKYEAEKNIIKCTNEINAKIFRVGNIMPRICDGKFQENYNENAFMLTIKELLNVKIKNTDLINKKIYLTPVDECCKAILKLKDESNSIYHIENDKEININKILSITEGNDKIDDININYNIGVEHLKELLNNKNNEYSKDITIRLLKKRGFEWQILDENYLQNIVKIAKQIEN